MSRRTIRTVILLATISIIGLITVQIFWVNKAFDLKEREFTDRVVIALQQVTKEILILNEDSTQIPPVKQPTSNYFVVSINDTLHPFLLESLLKTEFEKRNINQDFEYVIYDCFTDSIVYGKYVNFGSEKNNGETTETEAPRWDGDNHYFGVYFPDKEAHLLGQMGIWLFSSAILLIVIIFFAYTMAVILKQKRLSEIKTDFINNMTHEFKTPISTISVSSEMLMKDPVGNEPEKRKRYSGIIHDESNRLKVMVEKVLQMADVESSDIQLSKSEENIHQLIEQAVESMNLIIQEKNGRINLKLNAENPVIKVDKLHFMNIIYNLLDNAIKYCERQPEITIETQNTEQGIKVSVEDNGIGMDKEARRNIFSKFYRVPTGNVHNVKGFGLGLYYVKTITEAHKGKITLESEPGEGSRFEVLLPKF